MGVLALRQLVDVALHKVTIADINSIRHRPKLLHYGAWHPFVGMSVVSNHDWRSDDKIPKSGVVMMLLLLIPLSGFNESSVVGLQEIELRSQLSLQEEVTGCGISRRVWG